MPAATNKEQLLLVTEKEFTKLSAVLADVSASAAEKNTKKTPPSRISLLTEPTGSVYFLIGTKTEWHASRFTFRLRATNGTS